MASSDIPVVGQQNDGDSSSATQIPPLNKWLNYVDRQVAPDDLPLLKLCLHPLFKSWAEASEASSPTEVFHCLLQTSSECEHRIHAFLCALRVIGGRHRGRICESKLKEYGLEQPQDQKESTEFRFFQCFARVARDIAGEAGAKDRIEIAYDKKLEKNRRHFKHTADLFIAIYEEQLVRPESCDEFCEILQKCEDGEKYTDVMRKYKTRIGDMWSDTSSEPPSLYNSNSYAKIDDNEVGVTTALLGGGNQAALIKKAIIARGIRQHKRVLIVVPTLLIISFLTVSLLATSIYFLNNCNALSPAISGVKAKEGNTMVITDVHPATVSELAVTENVLYHEASHEVHLFLAEYGCDQLPTQMNHNENRNSSHLDNITAVYLMPGSTINYTISTSTSETVEMDIDVFVVKGLKNIAHFDPNNDEDYSFSKRVPIGPQEETKTTPVFYSIDSPGFYAMFFLLPPTVPLKMSVNSTLRSRVIDISQLRYTYNHTLYSDDDTWKQSLGWEICSHRKCLIADIAPHSSNTNQFVHLDIDFSQRYAERVYIPLFSSLTAVCGLVLIVLVLIPICIFVASKSRRKIMDMQSTPV